VTAPLRSESFTADHDRTTFVCGTPALDRYFREQATQTVRRRAATCFVAVDTKTQAVAGYYTLAAACVPLTGIPVALAKKLPRYPSVPVARLGRLAVASDFQGRKLGGALLWDAALRALRSEVALVALVVDAKDEAAGAFYRHHGFVAFGIAARQFVLPLKSLTKMG